MTTSFLVFQRKKGIQIYPENVVLFVLTALLFGLAYLNKYRNLQMGEIVAIIAVIWFIYVVVLIISNAFRTEKEYGEYTGKLTFHKSHILLNDNTYSLTEIKNIRFPISYDVKGNIKNSTTSFLPALSNGLKNKVIIGLKSGENVQANFLQNEKKTIKNIEKELISYFLSGKIEWAHLLEVVKIPEYEQEEILNGNYSNNYGQQRVIHNSPQRSN